MKLYTRHEAINRITEALAKQQVYDQDGDEVLGFYFEGGKWNELYFYSEHGILDTKLMDDDIEYLLDQVEPGARIDTDAPLSDWEKGVINVRKEADNGM